MTTTAPITILLSALGGEGGGVLADWLVDTARAAGYPVQGTSIPGVAQRTGATTYYIEVCPQPHSALGGRQPVFGLYAVPGALDLLVGSELLEAVRQTGLGLVSPERTAVVVSSSRALTVIEKMGQGDARVDDAALLGVLRAQSAGLDVLDMAALARQHGTVISAVMFGALAGWAVATGRLPFQRSDYEATIARGGKGVAASLRGFAAAFAQVQQAHAQRERVMALAEDVMRRHGVLQPAAAAAPAPAVAGLPAPVAAIAALGVARLRDYQDDAYASLYRQRLDRLVQAERLGAAADITGRPASPAADGFAASTEAARWLVLWMAFDDIVRVADLKSRASRFARVAREAGAADGELLAVHDHFKPGVPEFAAMLPQRWANALHRWDARRQARGQAPWALPLQVASHSVRGLLALRLLASTRRLRRWGSRYATEQALIERWLAATEQGLVEHPALGLALARCGRLIKGYGSTNERGKHHLLHVIDHLALQPGVGSAAQRAAAVDAACTAALADEAGQALDQTLVAHGAPPRPLVAQPIRWHRRPVNRAT
jgi:indolepyruvate ferredoxin oxidoreductase beta subunit